VLVTLDANRGLTVPAGFSAAKPGDVFEAEYDPEEDTLIFRRPARRQDWLTVLEECPVPMDDFPPRRHATPGP